MIIITITMIIAITKSDNIRFPKLRQISKRKTKLFWKCQIDFPDGARFTQGASLMLGFSLHRALSYENRLASRKIRFKENSP